MKPKKRTKRRKTRNRRSDLDWIVIVCVAAGLIMTIGPLLVWRFRMESIPDAYFQYGFRFWGTELITTVVVYWLKGKKKATEAAQEDCTGGAAG